MAKWVQMMSYEGRFYLLDDRGRLWLRRESGLQASEYVFFLLSEGTPE